MFMDFLLGGLPVPAGIGFGDSDWKISGSKLNSDLLLFCFVLCFFWGGFGGTAGGFGAPGGGFFGRSSSGGLPPLLLSLKPPPGAPKPPPVRPKPKKQIRPKPKHFLTKTKKFRPKPKHLDQNQNFF